MDQVDRVVVARSTDAEHDKLTTSTSSGSLIITDCGGESSSRSTGTEYFEKSSSIPRVPTGLKVVSLISMSTAIVLIAASGVLLHKTNQTLVKWLSAEPATMNLVSQVNHLLGGTTGIVEEIRNQEKYLRILITCSAVLVITGMVQLLCNIWFFCRMNAPCVRRCMTKSEQFFCGI